MGYGVRLFRDFSTYKMPRKSRKIFQRWISCGFKLLKSKKIISSHRTIHSHYKFVGFNSLPYCNSEKTVFEWRYMKVGIYWLSDISYAGRLPFRTEDETDNKLEKRNQRTYFCWQKKCNSVREYESHGLYYIQLIDKRLFIHGLEWHIWPEWMKISSGITVV